MQPPAQPANYCMKKNQQLEPRTHNVLELSIYRFVLDVNLPRHCHNVVLNFWLVWCVLFIWPLHQSRSLAMSFCRSSALLTKSLRTIHARNRISALDKQSGVFISNFHENDSEQHRRMSQLDSWNYSDQFIGKLMSICHREALCYQSNRDSYTDL